MVIFLALRKTVQSKGCFIIIIIIYLNLMQASFLNGMDSFYIYTVTYSTVKFHVNSTVKFHANYMIAYFKEIIYNKDRSHIF